MLQWTRNEIYFGIVLVLLSAVLLSGDCYAEVRYREPHSSPRNAFEQYVQSGSPGDGSALSDYDQSWEPQGNTCNRSDNEAANRGKLWITDSASDLYGKWSGDANEIDVKWGQAEATVYLAGSVLNCTGGDYVSKGSGQATFVTEQVKGRRYLKSISSSTINRGWGNKSGQPFTTPADTYPAVLDTSSDILPMSEGATVTITIYLRRCYQASTLNDSCGAAGIPLKLHRLGPNYSVSGASYISKDYHDYCASWVNGCNKSDVIFRPGETAYWNHNVWNAGPDSIDSIAWAIDRDDYYIGSGNAFKSTDNPGHTDVYNVAPNSYVNGNNGYKDNFAITQDVVGQKLCQQVHWFPSTNGARWTSYSNQVCALVPYHYYTDWQTTLSRDTIKPSQTYTATYSGTNKGPTKTMTGLTYARSLYFQSSSGCRSNILSDGSGELASIMPNNAIIPQDQQSSGTKTVQSHYGSCNAIDAEDQICSEISANRWRYAYNYGLSGGYNAGNTATIARKCASVPYHYPGCPSGESCSATWASNWSQGGCATRGNCNGDVVKTGVGVQPSTSANATDTLYDKPVSFSYSMSNGGPTKSMNVGWVKHVFLVPRKTQYSADDKTRLYEYGSDVSVRTRTGLNHNQYRELASRYGNRATSAHSSDSLNAWNNLIPSDNWSNVQVGDQVCSYLALDYRWAVYDGQTVNSTIASNVKCIRIAKNPQMQINGSDSQAERGFVGSAATTSERGSWTQYAQLTKSDKSKDFGSSGYTWAYGNTSRHMIFANVVRASQSSGAVSGVRRGELDAQTSVNSIVNTLRLASAKSTHIHYFNGSLTLNSNIDDGGIWVSQGNIYIQPNVTYIRGILVAGGRIETCAGSGTHGTSSHLGIGPNGKCDNRLVVDGAIVSGYSPVFHRTYGGGNQIVASYGSDYYMATAEKINYTPDLWLSGNRFSSGGSTNYQTINVISLPARY